MESVLSEKMVDAIKLSLTNSNPFMKTNILIKRASIFIFITFGFTLVNYFTLKNIIKKQTELSDAIKKLETTIILKTSKSFINRDVYKKKISKSTSTSNLLREDNTQLTIQDKNDSEYEILDECYSSIPCNNLKKNIH